MKAVLEFYADKPLERRRLKMATEAEQAFSTLVGLRDYCLSKMQAESVENGHHYNNVISVLDNLLRVNEISLTTYEEVQNLLEDL